MLIECKWEPSYELKIPQDWPSGVYLGKLQVRYAEGGGLRHLHRSGRTQGGPSFQCSDITWQSYNRWPAWRSLYDYMDNKWHTDAGNDVGFDRPYGIALNWLPVNYFPISNGSGEFLLWEFPLAFWLEKEGTMSPTFPTLTRTRIARLAQGQGLVVVGHDEYWTQQMYDNVTYARDHGVSLAFLSGNSVSGLVYLNPSTDGRLNRVFGRIKRFGEAERELMGPSSHGTGMADWTVEKPDHWIFGGTGMKKGDRIPQLVGWEYHGAPNGNQLGLTILATAPTRPTRQSRLQPAQPAHLDDLRTAQREHRLRRRHVLVEHGSLQSSGLHESRRAGISARTTRACSASRPTCSSG
jgi:hypothetical protein